MAQYIDKSVVIAEIQKLRAKNKVSIFDKIPFKPNYEIGQKIGAYKTLGLLLDTIDTLEVKDPEQCFQYDSIKAGIKTHAETYSFNIESKLFNQLTKEQQALWRKEIEQACISGGYNGLDLAKVPCYKENLEVKEADLKEELNKEWNNCEPIDEGMGLEIASIEHEQFDNIAKHFFSLALKHR